MIGCRVPRNPSPWLVLIATLTAACGTAEAPGGATDPAEMGRPSVAAADGVPVSTTDEAVVLADSPHAVDGIQVAVVEIRRGTGDTVTVRWRYRNDTPERKDVSTGSDAEGGVAGVVNETFLTDPANGKKFLVVRDADDVPLAGQSAAGPGLAVPLGGSLEVWATFPAPQVERVSVHIPGVAPFEGVPIESSR